MSSLLKFRVSAPGKVILHGEHSVVYGKPALAGVIGLRNFLTFQERQDSLIRIAFPKIGTNFCVESKEFNQFLATGRQQLEQLKRIPEDIEHQQWFDTIKSFILQQIGDSQIEQKHVLGLASVFYLLVGIMVDQKIACLSHGFDLESETEMSIGAGVGSSASFGVCLAGVFYFYAKQQQSPPFTTTDAITSASKEYISKWAFCSEKIMHGNPSGLDNTICTIGNIVKFYKGSPPIDVKLVVPLNILLVDTNVSRSTAEYVGKVAKLREEHPKVMDSVLNAMGELVEDVVDILQKYAGAKDSQNFVKLERLVTMNNNLLRTIGVSHESLEQIFTIAESFGFSVKLTGAGGGGYATVLLPPNYEALDKYVQLCEKLSANGFDWTPTTVGGDGVTFEVL